MSEENGRTAGLPATVPLVEVADIYLNLGIQDSLGLNYGLLRAERGQPYTAYNKYCARGPVAVVPVNTLFITLSLTAVYFISNIDITLLHTH